MDATPMLCFTLTPRQMRCVAFPMRASRRPLGLAYDLVVFAATSGFRALTPLRPGFDATSRYLLLLPIEPLPSPLSQCSNV
jgi:hypothetical protein